MAFIVVDYSKGNLRSVQRGLELVGAEAIVSANAADIRAAEAIVLPGVGSFADASAVMSANGQMQAMRERIEAGIPFIGICLGLQLLFERGNEGMPEGSWAQGLGILRGTCVRIASKDNEGASYKVPHVGWNQVCYTSVVAQGDRQNTERRIALDHLFAGINDGSNFYFTHSYRCEPADISDVLATTTHADTIPCVVNKGKVFGVQFHPEKSSHMGLAVLANFVRFVKEHR